MKKLDFTPIQWVDKKLDRYLAIMEEEQEESTDINNQNMLSIYPGSSSNALKVLSIDLSVT